MNCDQNRLQGDQKKQCCQESNHQLQPGQADLHLLVGSWKLGGIVYVFIWLERSNDPPEDYPGLQTYTFIIRNSYPINVFHLSFNFLCLVLP